MRCLACERGCEIPAEGVGFCRTRKNIARRLYTLIYGEISSISANPIEKKPLYHFWPGTKSLTIGSWSCNFTCPWCQNHEISKAQEKIGQGRYLSPVEFVALAKRLGCAGTSISFNEPTLLLEYALDLFPFAQKEGLYNTFVTNGYMTLKALQALADKCLDAMNIDLKGGAEAVRKFCGADVAKVWRNAIEAKNWGIWVELTTLVIPGVNDTAEELRAIARRIKDELGEDTPWHLNRYHPAYEFKTKLYVPPTPLSTLEKAREIASAEGLRYVYVGNVPGHPHTHTYCPSCGTLLIGRHGFTITAYRLRENRCPECNTPIPIRDPR